MSTNNLRQQTEEAVAAVRQHSQLKPTVGLILGSGLGDLVDAIEDATAVSYSEIPHIPSATVLGHAGRFVLGHLAGQAVIAMQGRVHFYEGYTMGQTTFPVRLIRALGANYLVVTNAAGGRTDHHLRLLCHRSS